MLIVTVLASANAVPSPAALPAFQQRHVPIKHPTAAANMQRERAFGPRSCVACVVGGEQQGHAGRSKNNDPLPSGPSPGPPTVQLTRFSTTGRPQRRPQRDETVHCVMYCTVRTAGGSANGHPPDSELGAATPVHTMIKERKTTLCPEFEVRNVTSNKLALFTEAVHYKRLRGTGVMTSTG